MKKIITLFFIVNALSCIAQTAITGTVNTTLTIPNVQRNFMGFNSGDGNLESIYNMNSQNTGMEVNGNFFDAFAKISNRICWRFPGGTTSNFYNKWNSGYGNTGYMLSPGESMSYINVNAALQNSNYGSYYNFNTTQPGYPYAKNNIIYPFINSITKNQSAASNAVFCLNLVNHYRAIASYDTSLYKTIPAILYDSRSETLKDTNKIKAITSLTGNYLNAFNNSTLSPEFKKIVRQNIDAFLTMVNNNVSVYKIELGNELFGYLYSDNVLVDYNAFVSGKGPYALYFPSDTKVWLRDDGSAQSIKDSYASLWTYAHLAKLYKVLLTDTLQKLSAQTGNITYANHLKNMKFGVPVTPILNSGFKRWDDFMRQADVKSYIGIDAYVMHPYLDSTNYFKGYNFTPANNSSITDLTREFNAMRDTFEISYNNRFFKKNHISLINALPAGAEVWYTEWNINFDNSRLTKVGNTLLHSMFYFDAMMNFFDINANKNLQLACNKTNPIKLCNYHISYTKNMTDYPLMRFTGGYYTANADPATTTNSTANSIEYSSVYYADVLLSPVLNDDSISYVNNTNGGFSSVANCSFRSFYKKDCASGCCKDVVYIYYNNKSANSYKIDINAALNISSTACVNATKNYLYANALYASMGRTSFRTDDILKTDTLNRAADVTIQRIYNEAIPAASMNQVVIPKYSLGYVKVEISVPTSTCACTGNRVSHRSGETPETTFKPEEIAVEKNTALINPATRMYPNPNTNGLLNVDIASEKETETQIRIFDIAGNLVKTFSKQLSAGQNLLQLDVSDIAKSIYIIHMDGDGINFTDKLIVQ
ncbi:MAG: hypothetical protein JWN78_81 [Bacteroidota bacterium]|nr:hypothetical protein [Bacteroidota bacterium]